MQIFFPEYVNMASRWGRPAGARSASKGILACAAGSECNLRPANGVLPGRTTRPMNERSGDFEMRKRLFVGLAALAVLVLPALARADDKAPSIVLKLKSIDGLLHDLKYLGELAGKGEELKQADEM